MAQAPRTFSIDFNRRQIFGSQTVEKSYDFKYFTNGDIESFRVYIVQPSTTEGSLQIINATGLTLKVALGSRVAGASPTVYTSVTLTPSADGNYFTGDLPLNVAAVAALFAASAADANVDLEFELTDTSRSQSVLVSPVVIHQQVISTALQDTPLPDVAIGRQEATAQFVKQVNVDSASPFQLIVNDSDGSNRKYVLTVNGGALRLDPIGS